MPPEYRRNTAHAYGIDKHFPPEKYPELGLDTDTEWLLTNPQRVGRVRLFSEMYTRRKLLLLCFRVYDPETPEGWTTEYYIADSRNFPSKNLSGNISVLEWMHHQTPDAEDAAVFGALWYDAKQVGDAAKALFKRLVLPVAYKC